MDSVFAGMSSSPPTPANVWAPLGAVRERERKFVATPRGSSRFLERLAGQTVEEAPDRTRPVTYNRTTYLDTADLLYLRSRQTGPARKLRIREYASAAIEGVPPTLFPVCFLELKQSHGGARAKTRLEIDPVSLAPLLAGRAGTASCAPPYETLRALIERDRPVPKVTSWYRRTSRVDRDRTIRITVDSGICFTAPIEPGTVPASAFPENAFARLPFTIVEVKCPGELPSWLVTELDSLAEVHGFSKFEQGMALLPGGGS